MVFAKCNLRDSIIVLRGDQLRNLIVESDFRLQHIEPRNSSGFEPILLVFQLALQEVHRLLLHFDERLY